MPIATKIVNLDGAAFKPATEAPDAKVSVEGRRIASFQKGGIAVSLASLPGGGAKSVSLPIAHVDSGAHGFTIEVPGLLVASFQCNFHDLSITANFGPGVKYRATITRGGKTNVLEHQTGVLTLKEFDSTHVGREEVVSVRVAKEPKSEAYSLTFEHEDQLIVLTPEGITSSALIRDVKVSGLNIDGFAITNPQFVPGGVPAGRNGAPVPGRNGAGAP